jgi:BlaI family transcriptional regulator, penicillinase repressor
LSLRTEEFDMKNKLPKLTPSEFEIMNAVWNKKEVSITEIMHAVNAKSEKNFARSTIQVQVGRLEEKGWLAHRNDVNKFLLFATVQRKDASMSIVKDVNERIFGGSCAELVKSLLNGREKISSDEIKKIRGIIDKYEGETL